MSFYTINKHEGTAEMLHALSYVSQHLLQNVVETEIIYVT
jgi:hypothetical protein